MLNITQGSDYINIKIHKIKSKVRWTESGTPALFGLQMQVILICVSYSGIRHF